MMTEKIDEILLCNHVRHVIFSQVYKKIIKVRLRG